MFWDNFYKKCVENNTKPNPLAKKMGISSGIVSKWKTQGTIPSGEMLLKIAKELNCSIDYLLDNNTIRKFDLELIEAYKAHPEHQASINALLGIKPADNVTKLQFDSKPAYVAAASGNEQEAKEPDIKTVIEIEKLHKKHNK